jgi:hypothetical protein
MFITDTVFSEAKANKLPSQTRTRRSRDCIDHETTSHG